MKTDCEKERRLVLMSREAGGRLENAYSPNAEGQV